MHANPWQVGVAVNASSNKNTRRLQGVRANPLWWRDWLGGLVSGRKDVRLAGVEMLPIWLWDHKIAHL